MSDEDEELPEPRTLEEWYDQLVEVAAAGNAPPFVWEKGRLIWLAKQEVWP